FGLPPDRIKVTATTTGKVPNTSATAASSGADLNAMAALDACEQIKGRIAAYLSEKWDLRPNEVRFADGQVSLHSHSFSWETVIAEAYMARVHLSAAGFY